MNSQNEVVKNFYNKSYSKLGFDAQRCFPNEELCRFMGRNFFNVLLDRRKEIKILETGCGSGANLWMIAKEGFDAYGIDLSEDSLVFCQKMLQKYNTRAVLSAQDMSNMNFDNNMFDAVVDVFSSYCLNRATGFLYLKKVFDILKNGGIFFSYFPSKGSDAYQYHTPSALLDSDTLDSIVREDSPYAGQLYPFRFHHPEEYASILIEAGFEIQYLETIKRTYHSRKEIFEFIVVEAKKR